MMRRSQTSGENAANSISISMMRRSQTSAEGAADGISVMVLCARNSTRFVEWLAQIETGGGCRVASECKVKRPPRLVVAGTTGAHTPTAIEDDNRLALTPVAEGTRSQHRARP